VITTGNEACLESFDIIDYLLDEGRTDVFLVFLENVKNEETFRRVAAKALAQGKPIVIAKVGKSDAGQRAALSHTAALAGAYDAYQAMFRRYGIVEGTDLEAMVDIAQAFSFYRDRLPRGTRVGIGTASGGGGGWLADACVAAGLEVLELDPETRARIDAHIPKYGTSQNPVDGTAQAIREIGYSKLAELIASSERVDAVIMVMTGRNTQTFDRERENLFRVARETKKPILLWSYTNPIPAATKLLSEAGYPVFTNMHNCARALYAMAQYRKACETYAAPEPIQSSARQTSVREQFARSGRVLCEYEAARALANYGVSFPRSKLAANADEAWLAARELGSAVAIKAQSPDLPHKTEAGAVVLGLRGPAEIERAYETVIANALRHRPDAKVLGALVQAMASPGLEMLIGVRRDAVFGPMLMVGLGGVHVEVLRDVALSPVPVSASEARALLGRLRGKALLQGVRGSPPCDVPALVDVIVRVSEFAADLSDSIEEIDLNPIIVHAQGEGVSVVDALIVRRSP
jgi:acyl-CoA synthetase (NDP forming)